jgi:hypothetical protein
VQDVDNNEANITQLLEKLKYCIHIQFRVNQEFREEFKKLLCRASYHVNGYSFNDVARACLSYGLDALLRLELDFSITELVKALQATKPKRGRPEGSPNKRVSW